MINQDTIIVTWGFGPTYRDRIKYQIDEASKVGYDKVMKYFILTDKVEDFVGLDKNIQDLIIDAVDIEELRKDDEFSKTYEPLPEKTDDDELYAKQIRDLSDNKGLLLSYGLKRYVIKALAERGITKFLYMDSDIELFYKHILEGKISEEDFWKEFNTPVNSVKGCGYERIYFTGVNNNQMEFVWSRSAGVQDSKYAFQACSIVADKYYSEIGHPESFEIITSLPILEGPLRLFNFDSPSKVMEYFNTFNHVYRLFLENRKLYETNLCGGYILCDYFPLALTNIIQRMESMHFTGKMFQFRVFFEDRFWGAPWHEDPSCDSETKHLISTKNKKEFLEVNAKLIECMKAKNQWPSINYSTY